MTWDCMNLLAKSRYFVWVQIAAKEEPGVGHDKTGSGDQSQG